MRLSDGFDVLVIDDASPDGTQDAVLSKIEQYPGRVYMETRQENSDLALPISMVSNGRCPDSTDMSSRWMPTSRTIPTTCRNSTINAATMVPT